MAVDQRTGQKHTRITRLQTAMMAVLILAWLSDLQAELKPSYPRLMGMNIGDPSLYEDTRYQRDLARFDVVVINFWPEWKEWRLGPGAARRVVRQIKTMNPSILVGQYTNLNEAKPSDSTDKVNRDLALKLDAEDWWLRDASGTRQQWIKKFAAFDINITEWTEPDRHGLRYSEWYADRNYRLYFAPIPELDIWYLDNSLSKPAVQIADWTRDGRDDAAEAPEISKSYRQGHVRYWTRIRERQPAALLIGNVDDAASPEYQGKLTAVFLEALIGKVWSTETRMGWHGMMARYRSAMSAVERPELVGFGVIGPAHDYRRMRYGLASCLLDDGLYSYSADGGPYAYGGVSWFDEFDIQLGSPIEPPVTEPWRGNVYRRRFEEGMVLVNVSPIAARVSVEPGYRRIAGKQDPLVNDGRPVTNLILAGHDGIMLVKATPK